MNNVKFYRLGAMQAWAASYKGIFVHLTGQSIVGEGASAVTYKPGLYFGGESGWEYLTNDATAITDAINNLDGSATIASVSNNVVTLKAGITEINGVIDNNSDSDITLEEVAVTGAAADVSTTAITDGQETPTQLYPAGTVQGTLEAIARNLASATSDAVTDVTMDTTSVVSSHTAVLVSDANSPYDASSNKLATVGTVTNAINALGVEDVEIASISALSNGSGVEVTLHDIKQTDGLIAQGSDNSDTKTFTVGDGALKLSGYGATSNSSIPTVTATDVFSANDTADSTIALSNDFVFDATNKTIGLRTQTAVSATNNIATMSDIASLTGAMHYKGGVAAYPTPTADTKAGDTYVVTSSFTENSVTYEVGDMLVANADGASATYTVVQSNMTIGTGAGQVATNDGALTAGKIVLATANGIETSGYGVTDLASQVTTVATATASSLITGESGVTITDTLTVGGAAQTGQVVTLKSGNDAIAVSNSGNTINLAHIIQSNSSAQVNDAAVKITTDKYGHVTATSALAAGDIAIADSDNHFRTDTVQGAIDELYTRSGQHSTVSSNDSSIAVTATTTNNVTNYNVELVWETSLPAQQNNG